MPKPRCTDTLLILYALFALALIVALACLSSCEAQAGLQNKIPVTVEGNKVDTGDKAEGDVRKDQPVSQTGGSGEGWTINLNLRDSILSLALIAGIVGLVALVALKYKAELVAAVKGIKKLQAEHPEVAGHVATLVKGELPSGLRKHMKKVLQENDAYVKPLEKPLP